MEFSESESASDHETLDGDADAPSAFTDDEMLVEFDSREMEVLLPVNPVVPMLR